MAEAKAKKFNFFKRIGKFFTDLISETKKIVWPGKKQVLNNTVATVVIVLIAAIVIVLLDMLFGWIMKLLIGLIVA